MLQRVGYETAFIGKWHMAPTDAPRRGFDYWLSSKGQGVYENPSLNLYGKRIEARGYTTHVLTDHAADWIASPPAAQPLALFHWHKSPHEIPLSAECHRRLFAR